jgi:branched-chain amino acid transport system substrate-binding protein
MAEAFTMTWGLVSAKDIVLGASVQLTGPVADTGRYYRDVVGPAAVGCIDQK